MESPNTNRPLGYPIERAVANLPDGISKELLNATQAALGTARDIALYTMEDANDKGANNMWHKFAAAAAGATGGFFGMPGFLVDLPVSTTIMLRSIADIARSNGESISDPETKAACMVVFAMGGKSQSDDAVESGYYALRLVLAQEVQKASEFLVNQTVVKESSPVLVRFMTTIGEHFGIQVTQKMAVQFVPVIGAAGGAMINLLFMDHFQTMARGHFTVRRLERKYGKDVIKEEYSAIKIEQPHAAGHSQRPDID